MNRWKIQRYNKEFFTVLGLTPGYTDVYRLDGLITNVGEWRLELFKGPIASPDLSKFL
jgi:hypothetical protein